MPQCPHSPWPLILSVCPGPDITKREAPAKAGRQKEKAGRLPARPLLFKTPVSVPILPSGASKKQQKIHEAKDSAAGLEEPAQRRAAEPRCGLAGCHNETATIQI